MRSITKLALNDIGYERIDCDKIFISKHWKRCVKLSRDEVKHEVVVNESNDCKKAKTLETDHTYTGISN